MGAVLLPLWRSYVSRKNSLSYQRRAGAAADEGR
jgi:hypothetical protein